MVRRHGLINYSGIGTIGWTDEAYLDQHQYRSCRSRCMDNWYGRVWGQVEIITEQSCGSDWWDVRVRWREVVQAADWVCRICGKAHTSGEVLVVYKHGQLPTVCNRGEGVNCRVTVRRIPYNKGVENKWVIHRHLSFKNRRVSYLGRVGGGEENDYTPSIYSHPWAMERSKWS